ncbi:MAG: hypothetical protein PHD72_01150 [Patescibacteria group bacterium]|nr:hypothetical protein [Patescibacteria group bacterium]
METTHAHTNLCECGLCCEGNPHVYIELKNKKQRHGPFESAFEALIFLFGRTASKVVTKEETGKEVLTADLDKKEAVEIGQWILNILPHGRTDTTTAATELKRELERHHNGQSVRLLELADAMFAPLLEGEKSFDKLPPPREREKLSLRYVVATGG